jgi:transketolase
VPEWIYPLRAKRFEPVTIVIAFVSAVITASVATIFTAVELDKLRAKQQKADNTAKLGLMASKEISNSQVELICLTAEVTNALDAAWGSIDTINHVLLVCDVADKQVGVMESAMQAAMGGSTTREWR